MFTAIALAAVLNTSAHDHECFRSVIRYGMANYSTPQGRKEFGKDGVMRKTASFFAGRIEHLNVLGEIIAARRDHTPMADVLVTLQGCQQEADTPIAASH